MAGQGAQAPSGMASFEPFRSFKSSLEIIRPAAMPYVRFPLPHKQAMTGRTGFSDVLNR